MSGRMFRRAVSVAAGFFIWALCAANFGDMGIVAGAVFGIAAAFLVYEYLTRRAEEQLTRDKFKDYE